MSSTKLLINGQSGMCMREGERTSLWTSVKIKPDLFRNFGTSLGPWPPCWEAWTLAALRRPTSMPPIKNETGTNPYSWTLTDPRGGVLTVTDPWAGINRYRFQTCAAAIFSTMRMYCEQCACAACSRRIPKHFRTGNRLCHLQSSPDW